MRRQPLCKVSERCRSRLILGVYVRFRSKFVAKSATTARKKRKNTLKTNPKITKKRKKKRTRKMKRQRKRTRSRRALLNLMLLMA